LTNIENNKSLEQEINQLQFNKDGLIPAIIQDYISHEILMMAWMNKEAAIETIRTGYACYFSRSRQKLWRKGETSGQTQSVQKFRIDCDADTVLLLVNQKGVACHTGRYSCFFKELSADGKINIMGDVLIHPNDLYDK